MVNTFKSELLNGIEGLINKQGGTVTPILQNNYEFLRISYFPELKHGLLAYDEATDSWDEMSGDINLAVIVIDNGKMIIETGDDGIELYTTTIKSVDEFEKAIRFFENAEP